MDAAYDDQVYVDDRTIDSHVKRLRKKFKASDVDFNMIETLYGVGYRIERVLGSNESHGTVTRPATTYPATPADSSLRRSPHHEADAD